MRIALALFVWLFSALTAYASPAVVRDASDGTFLGSAVRVCLSGGTQSSYYVTASHVVERVNRIAVLGLPTTVAHLDETIDLALLYVQPDPRVLLYAPTCLNLDSFFLNNIRPTFLTAPSTYHLSASLRDQNRVLLSIDGAEPSNGRARETLILSPVVQTSTMGVPGRDQMGSLIQFEGDLVPGVSGSVVSVFVSRSGSEVYGGSEAPCRQGELCLWRRVPIGIITVVSPERRLVGALSIATVSERLERAMGRLNPRGTQELAATNGGVQYLRSGIVHFRSPQVSESALGPRGFQPAGTSRGGDGSGVSRGNDVRGTSRGGDGSGVTRGDDGRGTSRGGDGTATGSGSRFSSGLILPGFPGQRWLHLKRGSFLWTEHEPFSEVSWMAQGGSPEGFFERDGVLYRTSTLAPWPIWIDPALTPSSGLSGDGCYNLTANQWTSVTPGAGPAGTQVLRLCSQSTPEMMVTTLHLMNGRSAAQIFQVRFTDVGEGRPLQINAAGPGGMELRREGLRTYIGQGFRIELDYSVGLTVDLMLQVPGARNAPRSAPVSLVGPIR